MAQLKSELVCLFFVLSRRILWLMNDDRKRSDKILEDELMMSGK